MYNHRKLKSSFFLRNDSYPEILLSKHKYYKKSGLYTSLNLPLSPISSNNRASRGEGKRHALSFSGVHHKAMHSTLLGSKRSKMLLEGISQLYLNCFVNQKDQGPQSKQSSRKDRMRNLSPTLFGVAANVTITSTPQKRKVKDERGIVASQMREIVNSQNTLPDERGLREMDSNSFTNGLLNVGYRYLCVS